MQDGENPPQDPPDGGHAANTPKNVRVPLPPNIKLSGNLKTNWEIFKQLWTSYELLTGLMNNEMKYRVATFVTCIGQSALEVHNGLPFKTVADRNNLDEILILWEEYCCGKTNVIYERFCFNTSNQAESLGFDQYIMKLRKLASTCEYGPLVDDMVRDRIVCGIRDDSIRKELLNESKLTLESCITMVKTAETTAKQAQTMSRSDDVNYVGNPKYGSNNAYRSSNNRPKLCKFCGRSHVWGRKNCPAGDKKCKSCGEVGHFDKQCDDVHKAYKAKDSNKSSYKKKSKKYRTKSAKALDSESDKYYSSDTNSEEECSLVDVYETGVHTNEKVEQTRPKSGTIVAAMQVNGDKDPVFMQVDCGASCNVLPEKYVPAGTMLTNTTKKLRMYSNHLVSVLGTCKLHLRNPKTSKRYLVPFYVIKGSTKLPLIGSNAAQQMKLITVNYENIAKIDGDTDIAATETTNTPDASEIFSTYKDVFSGRGCMPGAVTLHVDESVKPHIAPPRRVPLTMQPKLKAELERLEKEGVIEKVEEPTDWCSSLCCVEKPNGKLRLCIDPQPLNCALKRSHYPLPVIEDILSELDGVKVFTKADLKEGFLQCQLTEKSTKLTTFQSPWGRWKYHRMPYGISPAPELFQQKLCQSLDSLTGIHVIADDILITGRGETLEEATKDHDANLKALLERCRIMNIKLNKDKFEYKLESLKFIGHVLTAQGLKSDPSKVQAVINMPQPDSPAAIQRLIGMVKYLAKFIPDLSQLTDPLRQLTHKNQPWNWSPDCQRAFDNIKQAVSQSPVLKYFDINCQTEGQGDASEAGLGFALLQDGLPVMYASRALTSAERNYSQIEKELLAQVFGLERHHLYTYGRKIILWTDHKPLVNISKKPLVSAPKRLQNLLTRLLQYDVEIRYKPGPEMYLADTLSRAFLTDPQPVEREIESIHLTDLAVSEKQLTEIQLATETDPALQTVKRLITSGWPEHQRNVPPEAQPYYQYRHELSISDNVVFKGDRCVVPRSAREAIRNELHSAHLGVESTLRRARETVFWPGINAEMKDYLAKCEICNTYNSEQPKEPLINHELPDRPWEKIGIDFMTVDGHAYLVTVDYYSDYFELDQMTTTNAESVIKRLKRHFSRHGVPVIVQSDNGPPFNSAAYIQFAAEYKFNITHSSPEYPQSNGKVESAVKIAKHLVRKTNKGHKDINRSLLAWRNTPTVGLYSSPAQRMFGRRTRTSLPTVSSTLTPKISENVKENKQKKQKKQKEAFDRGAQELPPLHTGDIVRMRPKPNHKEWKKARVIAKVNVRSYKIQTEESAVYIRNRRHLRLTAEPFAVKDPPTKIKLRKQTQRENPMNAKVSPPTQSKKATETHNPNITRRSTRVKKKPKYLKDYV